MRLTEALSEFLTACVSEGKAKSTVVWYRRRLGRLVSFLGDLDLERLSLSDLRLFLAYLRDGKRLSEYTFDGYVRAVRSFFRWLHKEGHMSTCIVSNLKRPRLPKLAPKAASLSDIQALLRVAVEGRKSVLLAKRDLAIIMFLADTGCRVGGLVNLRLSDLDLEGRSALVTEKGSKSRYVFFSVQTQRALSDYLSVRARACSPHPQGAEASRAATEYVFVGERGRLSVFGVNQMLSKLKRRAGVGGRVNPHSFRHFFAKNYLLNGGDLASLSDLMGHSDVVVTKSSYSIFLREELQRKHDAFAVFSVQSFCSQNTEKGVA